MDARTRRLWLVGRDPAVVPPVRWLARAASAYERALLREILPLDWLTVAEGATTGLLVRTALALAGVPDDGGPPPPDSGWRGNALAAGVWLSPLVVIFAASRALTRV